MATGIFRIHLVIAVITAVAASLAVSSVASAVAASPGGHRWADTVFVSGASGDDAAVAVATDSGGFPIVVGDSFDTSGDYDIRYWSYQLDGILRWNTVATSWDGAAGGDDRAAGVVVDDARNCAYVAGTTTSTGGDTDIVILKVRDVTSGSYAAGQLLWARTFNASPGKDEEAAAIARDKYGSVYVTGSSQRSDGSLDLVLVKYRSNGKRAWARRFNNGGSRFDRGYAVAVRGSSLYVAGVSRRKGHHDDIVLLKYTLSGKRSWVRYYDDSVHRDDMVSAMALTSSSVYVCGEGKFTDAKPGDALLLKYASNGSLKWVRYTAGSGHGDDVWQDVAVDKKARVHVTGFCTRSGTGEDIVTCEYSAAGGRLWLAGFKTTDMDVGQALTVDSSRFTYVCGMVTQAGNANVAVIKYSAGGKRVWDTVYPDPAVYMTETDAGDDWPNDIAVAGQNVYVAGREEINHTGTYDADFLTLAIWR